MLKREEAVEKLKEELEEIRDQIFLSSMINYQREQAIENIVKVIKTLEIYDDDWYNEIKKLKDAIEFLEG